MAPIRERKVMLTSKLAVQFANELMLAPAARTRVGKISALISQKTGPKLSANARI